MKQKPTLSVSPEWKAAKAKFDELKAELLDLEQEKDSVIAEMNSGKSTDWLTGMAENLLAGITGNESGSGKPAQEQLAKINQRKRLVEKAVEIQGRKLEEVRYQFSKEICGQLRPEYQGIIKDIAQAAKALDAAMEREEQFSDDLFQADISYASNLPRVIFRGPGRLKDDNSRITAFFKEAQREQYI